MPPMPVAIKNRFTDAVIFQSTKETVREAVVEADLSGADLSGADLREADLREAKNLPEIQVVPDLKKQIMEVVEANPQKLEMARWHTCETTHCLAGWATTLHPQGKLLESLIGPNAAGALIFNACCDEVPNFTASNEDAMEWLKK